MMKKVRQNTIAIVYDFDGTLTPKNMQEYTLFPNLGIKDMKNWWRNINKISRKRREDKDLAWMRKIIDDAQKKEFNITRSYLRGLGKDIQYFNGIPQYFKNVNHFVHKESNGSMKIKHYIVSSGLKEIMEGTAIKKYFANIFGSEYTYNQKGRPHFPKVLITDTIKTQYMFRINKGREDIGQTINDHMDEGDRPVPFKNIIYIGDGTTDVPAMYVTKKNGGYSIAVYKRGNQKKRKKCQDLLKADRVHLIAEADYSMDKRLYKGVTLILKSIIQAYRFEQFMDKST